jgi:hypothetical protein
MDITAILNDQAATTSKSVSEDPLPDLPLDLVRDLLGESNRDEKVTETTDSHRFVLRSQINASINLYPNSRHIDQHKQQYHVREIGSSSHEDQSRSASRLVLSRGDLVSFHEWNADTKASPLQCSFPGCATTVSRSFDLSRHMKKHSPPEYPCSVSGCDRKGNRAFYRLDKLRDHQHKQHGMINGEIPNST